MPRSKRPMNLSSIVSLLVENFLPALRQKYLFSNFEQSGLNRKYSLQDRPHKVILHCLDRLASSARFTQDNVSIVDKEGIFEVKQIKGNCYTVTFKEHSCTVNIRVPYYLEHTHISNCSTWAFTQAHVASFDEVF